MGKVGDSWRCIWERGWLKRREKKKEKQKGRKKKKQRKEKEEGKIRRGNGALQLHNSGRKNKE